ncbi:MAG: hypothetical protein PHW24_03045 [Candidatus Moranbacteria bacterium]|nr:hypothetical protein [Candidatus Moranbacteria bacterium]
MTEKFFSKRDVGFKASNSAVLGVLRQDRKIGYVLGSARKSEVVHGFLKKNMAGQSGVTEKVLQDTISDMKNSNHFSSNDQRMIKHLGSGHPLGNFLHKMRKQENGLVTKPVVDRQKTYDEIMGKRKSIVQSAPIEKIHQNFPAINRLSPTHFSASDNNVNKAQAAGLFVKAENKDDSVRESIRRIQNE